jgi:transmembrane sensor
MLIFDAMPVAQVVEEVNRYRSGRIFLMNPEIGRRLLTAELLIAEVDKIVTSRAGLPIAAVHSIRRDQILR